MRRSARTPLGRAALSTRDLGLRDLLRIIPKNRARSMAGASLDICAPPAATFQPFNDELFCGLDGILVLTSAASSPVRPPPPSVRLRREVIKVGYPTGRPEPAAWRAARRP
jgi:hypothetical protein